MRTAKPFALLSLAVTVAGCEEQLVAPGVCPAFCPPDVIQVVDTVLFNSIERDSSFSGYFEAHESIVMQLTSVDAPVPSRGLIRFLAFSANLPVDDAGTTFEEAEPPDSFRLILPVVARNTVVTGVELVLHRLPLTVDSLTGFDELNPNFEDSTEVATLTVPDGETPDTLMRLLPAAGFPDFDTDGRRVSVGIELRGDAPTFMDLGTADGGLGARLVRFAKIDSSGTAVSRSDTSGVFFDTFAIPPTPPAATGNLLVGGLPTTRSLLRFDVPSSILDSTEVVGATLFVVPIDPALGAPGDTFRLQANALSSDFGPKSPLLGLPSSVDSLVQLGTPVAVGTADTIAVDISAIVAAWQADSTRPRALMLRMLPSTAILVGNRVFGEGGTVAQLVFGSSQNPMARPFLRLTFVPPFSFAP